MGDFTDKDYEAIEAAVMETARGRWFLSEHARRSRASDTAALLDAVKRLEDAIGGPARRASGADLVAELRRLSETAGSAIALLSQLKEGLNSLITAARIGMAEAASKSEDNEHPRPATAAGEDLKPRIIVVRHHRSEEAKIPLAEDAGDARSAGHGRGAERSQASSG